MQKTILLIAMLGTMLFRAQAQSCPNGGFENWSQRSYSDLDSGWYTTNIKSLALTDSLTVWSVPGHTGQAVHIETRAIGNDTLEAWITNSIGLPTLGYGGFPYTDTPSGMSGYYRSNFVGNDTGFLFLVFKKAGLIVASDTMKIYGNHPTFQMFKIITSLAVIPDSIIVGFASSNVLSGKLAPGSWIEVDDLDFFGATQRLVNGTFEGWANRTFEMANSWKTKSDFANTGITKSTDAYAGSRSMQLSTYFSGGYPNTISPAVASTGMFTPKTGPFGGLPYSYPGPDTLFGYYKYAPVGTDTGFLQVNLYNSGNMTGFNPYSFHAAATWTPFALPLGTFGTPDTMRIDIYSSKWPLSATQPGSTLKIDGLRLKSEMLAVHELSQNDASLKVYPNPVTDVLSLSVNDAGGKASISILDISGRSLARKDYDNMPQSMEMNIASLPAGMYFIEFTHNGYATHEKIMKK